MVYTQRIFWHQYSTPAKLARLLDFWSERRDICDEISYFTESDGGDLRHLPFAEVERRAAHLTRVVEETKRAGFAVAINVLNTIGHTSDGGQAAPAMPWRAMVGANGETASYCSCPSDERFLLSVRKKYRSFGEAGADRYWIDDDVRMLNHRPADWGCFCSECVRAFCAATDAAPRDATREELTAVIKVDPTIRRAWVESNADKVDEVLRACMVGLSAAGFTGEVGFMTSGTLLDCGAPLQRWFDTLSPDGERTWIRPGGGFWDEETPLQMLEKLQVSTVVRELAQDSQATYEVENYPYTLGQKSATITGLETLLAHAAMRIDGVMFNLVDQVGNPLSTYSDWVDQLREWVPLWNRAADALGTSRLRGWSTPISLAHVSQVDGALGLEDLDPALPSLAIQQIGIPLSAAEHDSVGVILDGVSARGMSTSELTAYLTRPLLLDGAAAAVFVARGLGSEIGLRSLTPLTEGVVEVFTEHTLNGEWAGFTRAATLNYFFETSYALQTTGAGEELSLLTDYAGKALGAGLLLTQAPDAAPVAILGHFPWRLMNSTARSEQLRNLLHHMAPDAPTLRVPGGKKLCAWWRQGPTDDIVILFNPSFDAVEVHLDSARQAVFATDEVSISPVAGGTSVELSGFSVCGLQLRD